MKNPNRESLLNSSIDYKKRKGNITKQDKTTLNKKMIMLIGAFRTIINNQFKKNFNTNFIRNK